MAVENIQISCLGSPNAMSVSVMHADHIPDILLIVWVAAFSFERLYFGDWVIPE